MSESLEVLVERVDGNVKRVREILEDHIDKLESVNTRLHKLEVLRDRTVAWGAALVSIAAAWAQRKEILSFLLFLIGGCAAVPVSTTPTLLHVRPVRLYVDVNLPECEIQAIAVALSFWHERGVPFEARYLVDTGDLPLNFGDVYVINGEIDRENVLGLTQSVAVVTKPGRTEIAFAIVTLDSCHPVVATHELGHALGLPHNAAPGSLMYPTVHGGGWAVSDAELGWLLSVQ